MTQHDSMTRLPVSVTIGAAIVAVSSLVMWIADLASSDEGANQGIVFVFLGAFMVGMLAYGAALGRWTSVRRWRGRVGPTLTVYWVAVTLALVLRVVIDAEDLVAVVGAAILAGVVWSVPCLLAALVAARLAAPHNQSGVPVA